MRTMLSTDDGDTVVLHGERIRLEEIAAPERTNYNCTEELDLAMIAPHPLPEVQNTHEWEMVCSETNR